MEMTSTKAARFLTPEAKEHELARWRVLRENGGRSPGCPDEDVYPLCDFLNAIAGICTLQSCAGHREGAYLSSAHLWLWFDQDMSERFDRWAALLAREPCIERVARMYAANGQEVTVIEFAGNERGLLAESGDIIRRFFYSL